MKKKRKKLNLKINDCCGRQPRCAFNKQGVLGIYCPCCKRFELARDGEFFLEMVQRWNKKS
jgi:hypothetical protein|nr:MAG TPA: hypothetical protein [Caudoviricetes sp.]